MKAGWSLILFYFAFGLNMASPQSKHGAVARPECLPEVPHETRTLRVDAHAEASPVEPGATFTVFSAKGAGSVERIQFAALGDVAAQENSLITITVDGLSYSATTGIFFLNQWQTDGGVAASNLFATKNLAVTYVQTNGNPTNGMGVYRKIYIPYYNSIAVTYTNASTAKASLYAQVDYYAGKPPPGLHPATQTYFHMYTYPFTTLTPFSSLMLLPQIAGPGQLDSIFLLASGPDLTPQWLEANPRLDIDKSPYIYGGTEDFFGGQYYFFQLPIHTDEFGTARLGLGSNGVYYTAMYRYFHDFPVVFQSSLSFQWANGQKDAGVPPTINAAATTVYYTAEEPDQNPATPSTSPQAKSPAATEPVSH